MKLHFSEVARQGESLLRIVYYSQQLSYHLQAVFLHGLSAADLEGSSSPMISHKD